MSGAALREIEDYNLRMERGMRGSSATDEQKKEETERRVKAWIMLEAWVKEKGVRPIPARPKCIYRLINKAGRCHCDGYLYTGCTREFWEYECESCEDMQFCNDKRAADRGVFRGHCRLSAADDHSTLWLKDSKPHIYVSQPYGVSDDARTILERFCKKFGLDLKIFDPAKSWYRAGSTYLIEITKING